MTITLTGTLARDAEKATRGADSAAVIRLWIDVGLGLPYEVTHRHGTGPDAHLEAAETAWRMRRGDPVTAEVAQVEERRDHGDACMVGRGLLRALIGTTELK